MLLTQYINFDAVEVVRGENKTDVIGRIENITKIFPPDSLTEILTSHVAEHFHDTEWEQILDDCLSLLVAGGKMIVECPDVVGVVNLWNKGHHSLATPEQLISAFYGTCKHQWKELGWHKWGYTQDTMAKVMKERGYEIVFKGGGRTHGMGARDLRVEGVKK